MLLTMSVLHVVVPRLPSSHLYMSETDQHHYNGPKAEAWHGHLSTDDNMLPPPLKKHDAEQYLNYGDLPGDSERGIILLFLAVPKA